MLGYSPKKPDPPLRGVVHAVYRSVVAILDDPLTACRDIDRCLQAARRDSKPVYLEFPRDRLDAEGFPIPAAETSVEDSDPGALTEAVDETLQRLDRAGNPVILAGVEIHRRGLQDVLAQLVSNTCYSGRHPDRKIRGR